MDIKEIAKRIRKTNNSYMLSMSPDIAAEFAEALIESYKAELLNEVGEPVGFRNHYGPNSYSCSDYVDDCAYKSESLYTSDQVAAAIIAEIAKYSDAPVVAYRHLMEDGWEYYDAPTGEDCAGCVSLIVKPGEEK